MAPIHFNELMEYFDNETMHQDNLKNLSDLLDDIWFFKIIIIYYLLYTYIYIYINLIPFVFTLTFIKLSFLMITNLFVWSLIY